VAKSKHPRVARGDMTRFAKFIAGREDHDRMPTLAVWVDVAREYELPVVLASESMEPRHFALPQRGRAVITQETPGSYAPAWLIMLFELCSNKDGVLPERTWARIVARKGALHSAWMLGGYETLLKVWRAPLHVVEVRR